MDKIKTVEQLQAETLRYYEKYAETVIYKTKLPDRTEWYQPFISLLPAHAHILDAGCGAGYDSLNFIRQGFELTAIDASEALTCYASQLIQKPVLRLKFEDMQFVDQFDGIWASASLLHVPRENMPQVLNRLEKALKVGGVLYASFVYGVCQTTRGGILFNDYTEKNLKEGFAVAPALEILRIWKTSEPAAIRPGRDWLHVLARKTV